MNSKFSLHLIPQKAELDLLEPVVAALAKKYNGPTFVPHLTLYHGELNQEILSEHGSAEEVLARLSADCSPLSLELGPPAYGTTFVRTLYLTFFHSDELTELQKKIAKLFNPNPNYTFRPHMSLLYGSLESHAKEQLVRSLQIPFSEIHFDELRLVSASQSYTKNADIEAESLISSAKLL